jgi:F-type H+-transporting ATPase subunit gamma
MPSLIDIRRRIRSVRNTQQITRAMKMVSAAKLRRAQDKVLSARPYARLLEGLLTDVSAAARSDERIAAQPLLAWRPERRIRLVLVTADRGLAGAFNANLIKAGLRFLAEHAEAEVGLFTFGRKGRDFFRKRNAAIVAEWIGITEKIAYADAASIARGVMEPFGRGEIDAVYLLFNRFKSVVAQELVVKRVLPLTLPEKVGGIDFIYEQPPLRLLEQLLPRYVEVEIYQALLESAAAQQAARMTAMDAATSNATDMIDRLTLYMNRVRQASITKEIIEVVSGAAAAIE